MSTEKLKHIKVVVVAFRVKAENSIAYRKFDTPNDKTLGCYLNKLFHSLAVDFVSIRVVRRES